MIIQTAKHQRGTRVAINTTFTSSHSVYTEFKNYMYIHVDPSGVAVQLLSSLPLI